MDFYNTQTVQFCTSCTASKLPDTNITCNHLLPETGDQTGIEEPWKLPKLNKNFWHNNCHTDTRGHTRTRLIVWLMMHGLPPDRAEAIAFCLFGNPLKGGMENV